jgi:hypothetical protein
MATIGQDCHVILDGQGFWLKAQSYERKQARVRKGSIRQDGSEAYVDLGPGKHVWRFTVLAFDRLRDFSGATVATTGQQYRDALWSSYAKINTTLAFTDPAGTAWTVHFDNLDEYIPSLRSQLTGTGYELDVELVEG